MNKEIWIRVGGEPVPQGSKTAKVINGRAVMWDSNPHLKTWRESVAQATWRTMHSGTFDLDALQGPLTVTIWTYLTRPKTATRPFPSVKPDVDKLARSILDGLTEGGAFDDDCQVVELSIRKAYADNTPTGALIHIQHCKEPTP